MRKKLYEKCKRCQIKLPVLTLIRTTLMYRGIDNSTGSHSSKFIRGFAWRIFFFGVCFVPAFDHISNSFSWLLQNPHSSSQAEFRFYLHRISGLCSISFIRKVNRNGIFGDEAQLNKCTPFFVWFRIFFFWVFVLFIWATQSFRLFEHFWCSYIRCNWCPFENQFN